MVVNRNGIGEAVFRPAVENVRRQREKLVEVSAGPRDAVIENSLALHPSVIGTLVDDIDLLDIAHADVRYEHRAVRKVPREPVGVPETVGVDFAERLRIAVCCELVD